MDPLGCLEAYETGPNAGVASIELSSLASGYGKASQEEMVYWRYLLFDS